MFSQIMTVPEIPVAGINSFLIFLANWKKMQFKKDHQYSLILNYTKKRHIHSICQGWYVFALRKYSMSKKTEKKKPQSKGYHKSLYAVTHNKIEKLIYIFVSHIYVSHIYVDIKLRYIKMVLWIINRKILINP